MPQTPTNRPTMKDVAAEAGVALGTVSKVINGVPVGDEYRIRVEEAIKKLNYQINTYARGLKTSKTYCITFIIPNATNPFFASLIGAMYRAVASRGYRLLLCCSDYDAEREQEFIDMASQNRVDGIVGLTYNPRLVIPQGLPFIAIDRYFSSTVPCVSSDNFGGGRLAAEKLVELGCKRLLFLRIGSNLTNEPNRRKDGFIAACEALKVDYSLHILQDGQPIELFETYLKEHTRNGVCDFDGIFCVTDFLAYRIKGILTSLGVRVPEQVQLIGFDGVRLFGDQEYTCSTIVQPVEGIAEACLDLLLTDAPEKRPSQINLPVSYAYGGTTKA